VPKDREAKPVGAVAWGSAFRRVWRLAANAVLLEVVDDGAGAGEGDAAESPQIIRAWETAKLAAKRRSTRAGAGDGGFTFTDGMANGDGYVQ
jgi:hypothetical protein